MPTDNEIRCDDHIGEPFPVRCAQCEILRVEFSPWPTLTAHENNTPNKGKN